MTPEEVAVAISDRPHSQNRRIAGHWFICGEVSIGSFVQFECARDLARQFRLSAFSSTPGGNYAVMTHEAGRHQHRFILPLYDPGVADLFASIERGGSYAFSLGEEEQAGALIVPSVTTVEAVRPVRAMCGEPNQRLASTFIRELPDVVNAFTYPDAIPSLLGSDPILALGVSLIMPEATLALLGRSAFFSGPWT
jgi:hypothetical protein